jgi:hypothetical protein
MQRHDARANRVRMRFQNTVSLYELAGEGRRGDLIYRDHNITTILGKTRAAELLGGLDAAFISRVQIGDGGTDGISLNIPIAPDETDVALVNVLQDEFIISASLSAPNVLRLEANFFTANPNLNPFLTAFDVASEAGLVTQDSILFARITFPSIPFNPPSRTGLVVVWELELV